MSKAPRHFLDISELPLPELRNMLDAGAAMKAKRKAHEKNTRPLEGKTLAMIFERPSTRTRVSFDVGMRQLGGEAIMLTGAEMQLGRGETIADTARVLSRYVDAIMIRILSHRSLLELADHATVPVINGLTRLSHPCQVMADIMTFEEHRGAIKGRTVAWTGDANNVMASWAHAAQRFDFRLNVATPKELAPTKPLKDCIRLNDANVRLHTDPEAIVRDSGCVHTVTWVSLGANAGENRHQFVGDQIALQREGHARAGPTRGAAADGVYDTQHRSGRFRQDLINSFGGGQGAYAHVGQFFPHRADLFGIIYRGHRFTPYGEMHVAHVSTQLLPALL